MKLIKEKKMKVLIVYYSWSGNTKRLADEIASEIPVNTEVELKVPAGTFSEDMYQTYDIFKKQLAANNYPAIQKLSINPGDFDLILVGSPVWGGKPASPIHTFLDQIQGFKGEVASFYTDAGTVGDYEQTFKEWAKNLNVVKVFTNVSDAKALIRK